MIEFIRNLFTINHEIIYFVYGLMFFVLGLSIALQSRHSSHLDLARSVNWLAAFGFLHGFHEWGDLFIPLQAVYLAPGIILYLQYFHLLLLAVSFAAAGCTSFLPPFWLAGWCSLYSLSGSGSLILIPGMTP
jgi:hypothetical protein